MRKSSIFLLFVVLTFSACKKEDNTVFDHSPDERLSPALTNYQDILTNATNGWKGYLYPSTGGTYFFYFKFNNQNRVTMYSTFDSASAVTSMESSYRLKALQQPSLIFDTYSYLHVLADPNSSVNGGTLGQGLQSDFEFAFESASADSVVLKGRFHGSKMVLVRATQQEATAYNNRALGAGLAFANINMYLNYFKRFTASGVTYEISVNQVTRTITLTWLDATGNVQSFSTGFYYSDMGVTFASPLVNGSQTITGFTNINWNQVTTTLTFDVNGTSTTVVGLGQPLKVDLTAPQRWWQYSVSNGDYWISRTGFLVNGIEDAYGWKLVPGFQYLLYWAQYGTSGGINYDLMAPVVGNAINYGSAYRPPTFTSDGRVIFTNLGTLGTVPANANTAFVATRTQMLSAQGYYLVQTGPLTYDMVSALDGKAWITWEW